MKLPAALVNSRFLKSSSSFLLGAVLLVGCAPEELGQIQDTTEEPMSVADIRLSAMALSSEMEMIRDQSVIRVGQSLDVALQGAFSKPAKATRLTELPPGLDETFEVDGWETYRESLALVAKEDQVVLALYQVERAGEETVDELEEIYSQRYAIEPVTVETPRITYRFWQSGGVRLMTVRSQGRNGLSYTVALGLEDVMNMLRMSYSAATTDASLAESQLDALESSATNDGDGASE